jgi:hypothetical protein
MDRSMKRARSVSGTYPTRRPAMDTGMTLQFQVGGHWPGTSEFSRSTTATVFASCDRAAGGWFPRRR